MCLHLLPVFENTDKLKRTLKFPANPKHSSFRDNIFFKKIHILPTPTLTIINKPFSPYHPPLPPPSPFKEMSIFTLNSVSDENIKCFFGCCWHGLCLEESVLCFVFLIL